MAGAEGHLDAMAMYAGAAVGSVTDIRPAAEVIAELVAELEQRLPATVGREFRAAIRR